MVCSYYFNIKIIRDWFLVVSIEDAFDQDDWDAWTALTQQVSIQIVG